MYKAYTANGPIAVSNDTANTPMFLVRRRSQALQGALSGNRIKMREKSYQHAVLGFTYRKSITDIIPPRT